MSTDVMGKNEVQLFQDEKFGTIRTVVIDGEPWFVAADVCKILGVSNPTDALNKGLEDFEKARLNLGLQGGATNIISESGFYTLVLRSRKSIAKPFRIWVTSEVLPSIRKTGSYTSPVAGKMDKMLEELANMKVVYAQINNMENMLEEQSEVLEEQNKKLEKALVNMTLTTTQQGKLQRAVKNRVRVLLDGAHSQKYKNYSRMYFINLWNGIKETFKCGSHWQDLNPVYFGDAIDFIEAWEYTEN